MFNSTGERITYCRSLLGISRVEMAEKIGALISLPTLARWEANTVEPTAKKIEILASFFIQNGISVNSDWLKAGKGQPPFSINLSKFDNTQFDELAYSALAGVKSRVRDFFFQQVNNNFLKPIITYGDYIGGVVEQDKKIMDKKLCFIYFDNVVTAGFYYYKTDSITNLGGETQSLNNAILGEIQWIVRRP